jgi:hypothetical protein
MTSEQLKRGDIMRILSLVIALLTTNSVFASQVNCYGIRSFGELIQILDAKSPESTRVLFSNPDQENPAKVNTVFDQGLKFTEDGMTNVELGPIRLGSSTTTVKLYPAYKSEYKGIEGMNLLQVVLGQEDQAIAFPGKLTEAGPGLIPLETPLLCYDR